MSQVRPSPIQPKVVRVKRVRRRLNPVSDKRAKENVAYSALKKMWHPLHPYCGVDSCPQPSMPEPHHVRGRNGWRLCDVSHWMPICYYHHRLIHDFPEWAYGMGYMVSRVPTPQSERPTPPKAGLMHKDL